MALIARTIVVVTGIAGAAVTSQAPEFTQQYRQRLGGALQELRTIVEDFDADANRSDLSRQEALSRYRASADAFLRERGMSIGKAIHRYESLQRQAVRFETWPDFARPAALIGESDPTLVHGAWQEFRPGVPLTATGAIWAALGFLAAALLAQGGRIVGRGTAGAARRRGVPATRQGKAAYAGEMIGGAPEVLPDPDGPTVDDGRHIRR
ncbi:DUF2937 family protein [Oricola indica]|uniref:DUF2937 family protein n=1 Tax=Oricola indica TaxID=2872591 RepID=UPI001CBFFEEB|nr:DUF2937 family protein [Oricola indica]